MKDKINNLILKIEDVKKKVALKSTTDPHIEELTTIVGCLNTLHGTFSLNIELHKEIIKIKSEQETIARELEYIFNPNRNDMDSLEMLEYDALFHTRNTYR